MVGYKRIIILVVFLLVVSSFAYGQRLHLLPRDTELVSEKRQGQGGPARITIYKYYSNSTQKEILEFYRHMLYQDGFKETQDLEPQPSGYEKQIYFFGKQVPQMRTMVMINFLLRSEKGQGTTTYFITVYEIDATMQPSG